MSVSETIEALNDSEEPLALLFQLNEQLLLMNELQLIQQPIPSLIQAIFQHVRNPDCTAIVIRILINLSENGVTVSSTLLQQLLVFFNIEQLDFIDLLLQLFSLQGREQLFEMEQKQLLINYFDFFTLTTQKMIVKCCAKWRSESFATFLMEQLQRVEMRELALQALQYLPLTEEIAQTVMTLAATPIAIKILSAKVFSTLDYSDYLAKYYQQSKSLAYQVLCPEETLQLYTPMDYRSTKVELPVPYENFLDEPLDEKHQILAQKIVDQVRDVKVLFRIVQHSTVSIDVALLNEFLTVPSKVDRETLANLSYCGALMVALSKRGHMDLLIREGVTEAVQKVLDWMRQQVATVDVDGQQLSVADGLNYLKQKVSEVEMKEDRFELITAVRKYNGLLPFWYITQLITVYENFVSSELVVNVQLQQFLQHKNTATLESALHHGITVHECLATSLLDILPLQVQYLSQQANGAVVKLLHQVMNKVVPFDVVQPLMRDKSAIARPIRITLVPEVTDEKLNTFVISVQSIASFKSLQEFILPRVHDYCSSFRRRSTRRQSQASPPLHPVVSDEVMADRQNHEEDDEDEDDDDGGTDGEEVTTFPTGDLQTHRLRKDSSVVYDVQQKPTKKHSSDWKVSFTFNDVQVPLDMTLYGAIHRFEQQLGSLTIKYLPVKLDERPNQPFVADKLAPYSRPFQDGQLIWPQSKFLQCARLLEQLYNMKELPKDEFVSTYLTQMLLKQLQIILIVASNVTPAWCKQLCVDFGFMVPFEDRLTLLNNAAFGTGRALMRFEATGIGRLSRQKIRVHRENLFKEGQQVLDTYAHNSVYLMEVKFAEEVGSGQGPTAEFYSLMSWEFQKASLGVWRSLEDSAEYVQNHQGLFPRGSLSKEQINLFCYLGKFIAKSMLDYRIIDIPLNVIFIRRVVFENEGKDAIDVRLNGTPKDQIALAHLSKELDKLHMVDFEMAKQLRFIYKLCEQKSQGSLNGSSVDQLSLYMPHNDSIAVTVDNIEIYLARMIDSIMYRGIEKQVAAFRRGFNQIFPLQDLTMLTCEEIQMLWSTGEWQGNWRYEVIMDAIKFDHGLSHDSKQATWFLEYLCSLDQAGQQKFLQFITGGSKLPLGGFKKLSPPLTVVSKPLDNPDSYLPSVMTCVNFLKLPLYTSKEAMVKQLQYSVNEGQGSFHLS